MTRATLRGRLALGLGLGLGVGLVPRAGSPSGGRAAALGEIAPAQAGGATHLLLITGLSGEPGFAQSFHTAAVALFDAARVRWGIPDSNLVYLAEDPAADRGRIRDRATRENLAAAFAALARRTVPGDVVLVVLIGHGSGEGPDSRVGLPGPDATAADFAEWLKPLAGRVVAVVNAASGSGDFLPALSAPGRVVITATKSAMERNESKFARHFAEGLAGGSADADKDGRVTLLEAFGYARAAVAREYEAGRHLATEHAQLDDDGDGKGSADPGSAGADGALARTVAFGTAALPSDPRIAALVSERRALEAQVDALRRRKGSLDSLAYERELERLLLEIAAKTQAINAATEQRP